MNSQIENISKEETMIREIADMFQDTEFGFDVFVLMKDEEKKLRDLFSMKEL